MENQGEQWFFKAASQADIDALKTHLQERGVTGAHRINPQPGDVFFIMLDCGVMDGHNLPATLQMQQSTGAAWQLLEWA
ncbi:hypothetical protein [Herbaspirillum seropedicae]|uniref:hypothetical protein n=1 Tax=Herbaspirillum seropedicae TaxID=964 RepID=UPI003FCD9D98